MTTGYSKRPLAAKLGLKAGMRALLINPPTGYLSWLEAPDGVEWVGDLDQPLDFVQAFFKQKVDLEDRFPALKELLASDGMLWISWLKKASKIPTDLDDNHVRDVGLAGGLVDVKVAAVDANWSGLKFVYRLKDRG